MNICFVKLTLAHFMAANNTSHSVEITPSSSHVRSKRDANTLDDLVDFKENHK